MAYRIQPEDLLAEHGTTYAEEAGITLRDEPAPLFQLLVLALLSSAPIGASVAAATCQEILAAGWRTPERLRASTWQERVDALGRGGYRRYDESTATYLDEAAAHLQDAHGGDLRRLRPDGGRTVADLEAGLRQFGRIGPTGAGIFCREVQAVWPSVRPYVDDRAERAAAELGYPRDPARLAALVGEDRLAALTSALVRWSLS